jgi:hypothetical protein
MSSISLQLNNIYLLDLACTQKQLKPGKKSPGK